MRTASGSNGSLAVWGLAGDGDVDFLERTQGPDQGAKRSSGFDLEIAGGREGGEDDREVRFDAPQLVQVRSNTGWKALQRSNLFPWKIGSIVAAALVLLHFQVPAW
jgi:hypothetical protein